MEMEGYSLGGRLEVEVLDNGSNAYEEDGSVAL